MEPMSEQRKRNVAYKVTIGEILKGKPAYVDEKLIYVELGEKKVMRVNILANCIDKFISDGEKKYGSLTVDDASGQIRLKVFSEDIPLIEHAMQGDTLQIIGNIRIWNDELYLLPEIVKSVDPRWLLVRKLEIQQSRKDIPQTEGTKKAGYRDIVLQAIKDAETDGGIDVDHMIMTISASPDVINNEIKALLEEGLIYEPRPGRLRYLG